LEDFIGLHDHLPRLPRVPDVNDEAPLEDVGPMAVRVLEHPPQVNLVERTILHALQEMGA
jgi:hypothetical protein